MSKEKEIRDAGMAIIKQLLEEIQSKDKEIAELNNTIIKQNREIEELLNQFNDDPFFKIATQLSEIQSLKEEVERLKKENDLLQTDNI